MLTAQLIRGEVSQIFVTYPLQGVERSAKTDPAGPGSTMRVNVISSQGLPSFER